MKDRVGAAHLGLLEEPDQLMAITVIVEVLQRYTFSHIGRADGGGAQPSNAGAYGLCEAPPWASGCCVKKSTFSWVNSFHSPGTSSAGKIASTGHTGMHASQSTH